MTSITPAEATAGGRRTTEVRNGKTFCRRQNRHDENRTEGVTRAGTTNWRTNQTERKRWDTRTSKVLINGTTGARQRTDGVCACAAKWLEHPAVTQNSWLGSSRKWLQMRKHLPVSCDRGRPRWGQKAALRLNSACRWWIKYGLSCFVLYFLCSTCQNRQESASKHPPVNRFQR